MIRQPRLIANHGETAGEAITDLVPDAVAAYIEEHGLYRGAAFEADAIELEAGNKLAYRNRALAYKKLGEMRKAQADYDFVVKLEQGADNDPFKN